MLPWHENISYLVFCQLWQKLEIHLHKMLPLILTTAKNYCFKFDKFHNMLVGSSDVKWCVSLRSELIDLHRVHIQVSNFKWRSKHYFQVGGGKNQKFELSRGAFMPYRNTMTTRYQLVKSVHVLVELVITNCELGLLWGLQFIGCYVR